MRVAPLHSIRACVQCEDQPIPTSDPRALYCSGACKAKAWRQRHADDMPGKYKSYYIANRERLIAASRASYTPEAMRRYRAKGYSFANCVECQDPKVQNRNPLCKTCKSAQFQRYKSRPQGAALIAGQQRRRRARKLGAAGNHTNEEWLEICALQAHLCYDCGEKRKLTQGHLIPLSRGGSNYIVNIIGQCRSCNASQGAKFHPSLAALAS